MRAPNWKEWRFTPTVNLWQACALSLDIDPYWLEKPNPLPGMMGISLPPWKGANIEDENKKKEFLFRLRVLKKNIDETEHFFHPVP